MEERQRFLDACLLQAAGRLPADESRWLARTLNDHPEWQSDFDAAHELVRLTRETLRQQEDVHAPLVRFEDVMARLPAHAQTASVWSQWRQRCLQWWQQPGTIGVVMATLSAMAIGLGVQTHRLDQRNAPQEDVDTAATNDRSAKLAEQIHLAVRFMPDASMTQVSALLMRHHMQIIGGPDDNQTYLISAPATQAESWVPELRSEPTVMSVTRVVIDK